MPDTTAQLILTGGPVLTMDPAAPHAEALAVRDGTITAVGAASDVRELRGPRTEVVDLRGQALLPGFVEAHGHPTIMGLAIAPPALDVRPFTVPTGRAVLEKVRAAVAGAPGEAVAAYGIDLLLQRDLPFPTRELLDSLSPHAPLVLITNSGHAAYANTAAVRAAGLTATTPDPAGARFVRDAHGEPTGEAHESAAVIALMNTVAGDRLDGANVARSLRWSFEQHARVGITTVTEMAAEPRLLPALRAAAEDPEAAVRVRAYMMGTPEAAADPAHRFAGHAPARAGFGISGVKLWADGTPWQGSIATSFPLKDSAAARRLGLTGCTHGTMNYGPGQLAELAAAFTAQGFPLACHVHGDITAEAVLSAYEKAAGPDRLRALRPRLEHCGALTPDQFRRAARLGATVSLFMDHVRWWGDVLADDLYGPQAAARWMAARSAVDAGHRISLHNDGVCSPTDPLSGVATALTRRSHPGGRVHGAEERLTLDEALRAVTVNPAWQLHLEHETGMLRPGMRADLTVLNRDPHTVPAEALHDEVHVTATYLGGRPTWP
ncbi:amidohydrolase [Streptomyces sp. B-S-A8]|uniref:Amidohydrolase n=1 Tax=Streptomyces solicavernae TaxID=3043614 RepID=A0ABT6RLZ8_9ACTN|nr:amidohydrolase [Streptomyces sp. B-S-A8]MDI3385444.1 amidohydrolase [Streptomyces sp. B-S-A8]